MPQNRSTKFMESVVFSLYNYASNRREAYLLLQLFRAALREEVGWVFQTCRPGASVGSRHHTIPSQGGGPWASEGTNGTGRGRRAPGPALWAARPPRQHRE